MSVTSLPRPSQLDETDVAPLLEAIAHRLHHLGDARAALLLHTTAELLRVALPSLRKAE